MKHLSLHLVIAAALVASGGCDRLLGGNEQAPPAAPQGNLVIPGQPGQVGQPSQPIAANTVPTQPGVVQHNVPGQPGTAVVPPPTNKPAGAAPVAEVDDKSEDAPPPAAEARRVSMRSGMRSARGGGGACTNTCRYHHDGECDDGRPNAHTSLCESGTDCADCGRVGATFNRGGMVDSMGASQSACTNTCRHANDNECDDGRPNAHTSICARGTDCNDCGPVGQAFRRAQAPAPSGCTNTCRYANDNECDDGRPNSHTSLCARGTDCNDCGRVGAGFQRDDFAAARMR